MLKNVKPLDLIVWHEYKGKRGLIYMVVEVIGESHHPDTIWHLRVLPLGGAGIHHGGFRSSLYKTLEEHIEGWQLNLPLNIPA